MTVRPRKKRPCRICRKWFLPNKHAGDRQRVCSDPGCQRERHRRSCADWHAREADAIAVDAVARRVTEATDDDDPVDGLLRQVSAGPNKRLSTKGLRDVVGLEVAVIIQLSRKLIETRVRDAVLLEVADIIGKPRGVPPPAL